MARNKIFVERVAGAFYLITCRFSLSLPAYAVAKDGDILADFYPEMLDANTYRCMLSINVTKEVGGLDNIYIQDNKGKRIKLQ